MSIRFSNTASKLLPHPFIYATDILLLQYSVNSCLIVISSLNTLTILVGSVFPHLFLEYNPQGNCQNRLLFQIPYMVLHPCITTSPHVDKEYCPGSFSSAPSSTVNPFSPVSFVPFYPNCSSLYTI